MTQTSVVNCTHLKVIVEIFTSDDIPIRLHHNKSGFVTINFVYYIHSIFRRKFYNRYGERDFHQQSWSCNNK